MITAVAGVPPRQGRSGTNGRGRMTLKGMDLAEPDPSRPRYDGHADWYDGWARAGGAAFMAAAGAALRELLPSGSGLALDLGCGTGLHAGVAAGRGYTLLGVDVSSDQLRLAQDRLPVLRADARALPFADGCFQAVYSMLTHTDLDGLAGLAREGLRVLAPDGRSCYVGVHPCFVGPFVEVETPPSACTRGTARWAGRSGRRHRGCRTAQGRRTPPHAGGPAQRAGPTGRTARTRRRARRRSAARGARRPAVSAVLSRRGPWVATS